MKIKKWNWERVCMKCDRTEYCISRQILAKMSNKMPKINDPVKEWQGWMFAILNGLPSCDVKIMLFKKYKKRIEMTHSFSDCLKIAHDIFNETGVVDPI